MGDKGEEQGQKFTKDGEGSLASGPVKKRCCTDVVCIPIFLAHIFFFWILTFMNAGDAEPMKLIKPMDFKGDFCGIKSAGQWKGGSQPNLEKQQKLMWSMNMDEAFDPIAKNLVCSQVGYSALVTPGIRSGLPPPGPSAANKMDKTEFNLYCGLGVNPNPLANAAASVNQMQKELNDKVAKYTDPKKAFEMFTGKANSVGAGLLKQVTKYFNMVCTEKCALGMNQTSSARPYVYAPAPMKVWGTDKTRRARVMWDKFVAEVKAANQQSMLDILTFKAWSKDMCPYEDPRYCVPMPGVTFTDTGDWNMCMPQLDSGVADLMGGAFDDSIKGIAKLSVTEDISKNVGTVVADVLKTWTVFVIVAVCSLVIGLVVLIFMRFTLAPMVWVSLLLVFLLFVAGGLAIIVRSNQCADEGFVDSAKSQGASFKSTAAAGSNPFDVECAGGYSIESKDARTAAKIAGYVVLGIAAAWLLAVLIMVCRIRLAIAVNQVACMFLYNNPQVLLVPVIQNCIAICWLFLWCFCAAFLLSQVSKDTVPTAAYATYDEAWGTSDTEGKCTNTWPSGDVWVDTMGPQCASPAAGAVPLCYRCSPPRFSFDWKFGYSFFSFLWQNFFMVAVGQCTIAGAVGVWFFTEKGQKWKKASVCIALKNAVFWHTGSLAFGSLILAIVVWIKWFLAWLEQQAKQTKNKVMEIVCKILGYCVWCFEKCVKFLNKNAYIQIALLGKGFCQSAKAAFFLILRNLARFGVVAVLAHLVHLIGMVLIVAATAVVGYLILGAMFPDVNPIAPTIFYAGIGWMTAKLFIGTFGLAVDATLQCFIAAEEMDNAKDFAPDPLQSFFKDRTEDKPGCCDHCCCTIM